MNKEAKIDEEFEELINKLTDEELKNWVWNWLDTYFIQDTCKDWDSETKEEEIKVFKKIIKNRDNRKELIKKATELIESFDLTELKEILDVVENEIKLSEHAKEGVL